MSAKNLKILVTGQSGILGSDLVPLLDGKYEVTAISRNPHHIPRLTATTNFSLDITHFDKFQKLLDDSILDVIINCAALTDVDRCETNRKTARLVNAEAVGLLANHCARMGSLLIHISTDYIFDGKAGPYSEDSTPNPINFYGVTKFQAEEAIKSSGCRHIIVRTSFLYGMGADGGSRVPRWILDSHREKKEMKAAGDQFSNPAYSANLANAIVELMEIDFGGIINVAGADYLSRYDFVMIAAEVFDIDKNLIKKVSFDQAGLAAPRPLRAGLKIDIMKKMLKAKPMGARDGLTRLRQELKMAGVS
jgi:dTDP-4-dehydrorhamnose reductase